MFGLHHAFTPIALNSLMVQGYENLTCYMAAVPFTTMAVVLAVYPVSYTHLDVYKRQVGKVSK